MYSRVFFINITEIIELNRNFCEYFSDWLWDLNIEREMKVLSVEQSVTKSQWTTKRF